jgi:hypothetical protein
LPDTGSGATIAVPPDEQSVGAVDCGPNTLKVIDPDGDAPFDNCTDADDDPRPSPTGDESGTLNDPTVGLARPTTVFAMLGPHAEAAGALSASPL